MEENREGNFGKAGIVSWTKDQVRKIYEHAYCRKHVRRTYFETDQKGIYSDVTITQYEILVGQEGNRSPIIIGASTFGEESAWSNAWSRIGKTMLEKLES